MDYQMNSDGLSVVCTEIKKAFKCIKSCIQHFACFKVLFCTFVSKSKFALYGKVSSLVIHFLKIHDIINLIVV